MIYRRLNAWVEEPNDEAEFRRRLMLGGFLIFGVPILILATVVALFTPTGAVALLLGVPAGWILRRVVRR